MVYWHTINLNRNGYFDIFQNQLPVYTYMYVLPVHIQHINRHDLIHGRLMCFLHPYHSQFIEYSKFHFTFKKVIYHHTKSTEITLFPEELQAKFRFAKKIAD